MYIGIVGPYAVGKTTFTDELVTYFLHHSVHNLSAVVVNCDNNYERYVDPALGEHVDSQRFKGRTHWKGTFEDKLLDVECCVEDMDAIWVCETAWSDHIRCAALASNKFGGGAKLVVITTQPDVYRAFLIDRCERYGKEFRADYWDAKRLVYEGSNRFLNAAKRYLEPAGVEYVTFEMDQERTVWEPIFEQIREWSRLDPDKWYA